MFTTCLPSSNTLLQVVAYWLVAVSSSTPSEGCSCRCLVQGRPAAAPSATARGSGTARRASSPLPRPGPCPQVPVACLLGFSLKLGVQGFYGGMVLGPLIQTLAYLYVILRLSWSHEAHLARQRLAAAAEPL